MPDALVATVTVPGAVAIAPSMMTERADHEWGAVRPSFPPSAPDADVVVPPEDLQGAPRALIDPEKVEPRSQETAAPADEPGAALPLWLLVVGGAATVGLAGWLARRYRRANT